MYHLPLLPGYGPAAKVRSSVPALSYTRRLSHMSQIEEDGYTGSYFIPGRSPELGFSHHDGYIARSPTASPPPDRRTRADPEESEAEGESRERGLLVDTPVLTQAPAFASPHPAPVSEPRTPVVTSDDVAEIVFFAYGVVVFFGFDEFQERTILEDVHDAGTLKGARAESEWEVEECHFAVSKLSCSRFLFLGTSLIHYRSTILRLPIHAYITTFSVSVVPFLFSNPCVQNTHDMARQIAFKSPSHLLTLSLSHALAQSTLLAHYESQAYAILQHPRTQALPRSLARTGSLALSRREAMRLTGKLFLLRRDVVLGRNVLDVPGIFWEEASLHALYDAGRAYFEIGERVQGLNERISGARGLVRCRSDTGREIGD